MAFPCTWKGLVLRAEGSDDPGHLFQSRFVEGVGQAHHHLTYAGIDQFAEAPHVVGHGAGAEGRRPPRTIAPTGAQLLDQLADVGVIRPDQDGR